MRPGLRSYMRWLRRDDNPAQRLCDAGNQVWVIHSQKGDGALTPHERAVLEGCDHVRVITLPGHSFFLPIEESAAIANFVSEALAPPQ